MADDTQYQEVTKEIKDTWNKSLDTVDKHTVLISSGALALSLTFVEKLGGIGSPYLLVLLLAWLCFAFTLMVTLYCHRAYSKVHELAFGAAHRAFQANPQERINLKSINQKQLREIIKRNNSIESLNRWAFRILCLGVAALIVFVSLNLFFYQPSKEENSKTPVVPVSEKSQLLS